jgi:hypothetical protein
MVSLMDLIEVAGELYGLPLDEFTAARNDRAKAAKAEGDKELAEAVKSLSRPSVAAWVVNQMVRHQGEEMEHVLALGASLRQAQESLDGDALRQLTRQRRQLTAAVTSQARALAARLGHRVTDAVATQVEETLHAAMVDETAAAGVRSGLLTEALSATGVGTVDVTGSLAVPQAVGVTPPVAAVRPAEPGKPGKPQLSVVPDGSDGGQAGGQAGEQDAERERRLAAERRRVALERAQGELDQAQAAADKAGKKLDKADRQVARLEARSLQVQGELEEVRRKAAALEHQLESVDEELSEAEEKRDSSRDREATARDVLTRAEADLEKLTSTPSDASG